MTNAGNRHDGDHCSDELGTLRKTTRDFSGTVPLWWPVTLCNLLSVCTMLDVNYRPTSRWRIHVLPVGYDTLRTLQHFSYRMAVGYSNRLRAVSCYKILHLHWWRSVDAPERYLRAVTWTDTTTVKARGLRPALFQISSTRRAVRASRVL